MIEIKDISQATDNQVEKDYSKITSLEHRRKFAQFFTPFQLATLMADWLESEIIDRICSNEIP